jgi:hypothetical protein
MREIRQSGSEGGVALTPPSLPLLESETFCLNRAVALDAGFGLFSFTPYWRRLTSAATVSGGGRWDWGWCRKGDLVGWRRLTSAATVT